METSVKTLIVKKRGRKYFDCLIGKYKAKLIINDVSKDLEIDRVVNLEVKDLSKRSNFGVTLIFEPLAIINDHDAAELRKAAAAKKDAEKWLKYAEDHVSLGWYKSDSITKALQMCPQYGHLKDRFELLIARVKRNEAAYEEKKKKWEEEKAERAQQRELKRQMRILFVETIAPPMGVPYRYGESVLVFTSKGNAFRINEEHHSIYGSHLLGHEGEYGCYYYYRIATEEEAATLRSLEQDEKSRALKKKMKTDAINEIKKKISESGERPEGLHHVHGERILNTSDVYGGGDWFVITESHIWYVRNNGADGDMWDKNNVKTGGAGAIGFRIPYDQELANQLKALDMTQQ